MEKDEAIVGERPFTAEERYNLRRMALLFREVTPDEVAEIRQLAHSGKATRTIIAFIAKFVLFLSGSLGIFAVIKNYFTKGIP